MRWKHVVIIGDGRISQALKMSFRNHLPVTQVHSKTLFETASVSNTVTSTPWVSNAPALASCETSWMSNPLAESNPLETLWILATEEPNEMLTKQVLQWVDENPGIRVLAVSGRLSQVFLGPFVAWQRTGCLECFELRWGQAMRRIPLHNLMKAGKGGETSYTMSLAMGDAVLREMVNTIIRDFDDLFSDGSRLEKGEVAAYNRLGHMTWRRLIPSCECARCRRFFHESRTQTLNFQPHVMNYPEDLRVAKVPERTLTDLYVDLEIGVVSALHKVIDSDGLIGVNARLGMQKEYISGFGLATTWEDAKTTAVLEALERQCMFSGSRETDLTDSYDNLRNVAIHPRMFGFPEAIFYETNSHVVPFSDTERYSWMWGTLVQKGSAVLIPRQLVYNDNSQLEPRFIWENSNGWAVGSTLEEAALHGVFEVLERDHFLNTWYGRIPLPRLNVREVQDSPYAEWLHARDYDVICFDMSLDLGFAGVMVVAVNRYDTAPKTVCSTALHLYRPQAVIHALKELAAQVYILEEIFQSEVEGVQRKFREPSLMKSIRDHSAVAALPEAAPRWDFLLNPQPLETTLSASCASPGHPCHGQEIAAGFRARCNTQQWRDILDALLGVTHHLGQCGYDVIVVDGTTPELRAGGFYGVKVLIPGMLPMTFGYGRRRIKGLTRVLELPYQLGYASEPLQEEMLNPNPHPFS